MDPYLELLAGVGLIEAPLYKHIDVYDPLEGWNPLDDGSGGYISGWVPEPFALVGDNEELYEFYDGVHDIHFNEVTYGNMDYEQEQEYARNAKPIHRYSRKDRFKSVLYQLLGISGDIPSAIRNIVRQKLGKKTRRNKIWNDIRAVLKEAGERKYYNRIPQIIARIAKLRPAGITNAALDACFEDFHLMHHKFDTELHIKWQRAYFPNLRFVALKLLTKHGITFPYDVPFVRTARKRKYLNNLWLDF